MRPAAGAVFFLQCDHVAGTHRTPVTLAAGSQSDTSQCSFREGATIVRKFEMSLWLEGVVVGFQTQGFGGEGGGNELLRILFFFGIPKRLVFSKNRHLFRSEHF